MLMRIIFLILFTLPAFADVRTPLVTPYGVGTLNSAGKIIQGNGTIYGINAGLYEDNTNNLCTVYTGIYNATDKTYFVKIVPTIDAQDYHAVFTYNLPDGFSAFQAGNAITIKGKADNGSGDGVNEFQITAIQDTAGTIHDISSLNIKSSAATLTALNVTKIQIDALAGVFSAGGVVRIYVKCFGNLGDSCYIDQNSSTIKISF